MIGHARVTEEIREVASAYALGLLEDPAIAEFEQHLAECPVCRSEAQAFREVTGELAYAVPQVTPPARLKTELLRRVASARVLVRAAEGVWQKTPFPGIEIRRLFVDKVTGAVTSLLRVAAGAVYPAHRHGGVEQVYVVDGDLIFNDHTLETGDYEVNPGSTDHSSITTKTGCLALVIHNVADEVFSSERS
ncbi:MAG TPA: cupin domain-containing protein [Bryobacteraceae bacterium]|nr:cupin domain-containing protein [Bryobacteraceae bacterium]